MEAHLGKARKIEDKDKETLNNESNPTTSSGRVSQTLANHFVHITRPSS
jgi:hypothetical protein